MPNLLESTIGRISLIVRPIVLSCQAWPWRGPISRVRRSAASRRRRAQPWHHLAAAAELATVEGLDGLWMRRLADRVGMSKSGIIAPSAPRRSCSSPGSTPPARSRPGGTRFALEAPRSGPRVRVLRCVPRSPQGGVFPGGCFFVSAAIELDAKDRPVRDHVHDDHGARGRFRHRNPAGPGAGPARPLADPDQLPVRARLVPARRDTAFVFFGDAGSDRARAAVRTRSAAAPVVHEPLPPSNSPDAASGSPRGSRRPGSTPSSSRPRPTSST